MNSDDAGAPRAKTGPGEFDNYASTYQDLLQDPLREFFSSRQVEFFHQRKRDLLLRRFARLALNTRAWSYLDVGCGQGELLHLLSPEFAASTGCDTSPGMLRQARHKSVVLQENPLVLPFEDCSFDFVTAVCVYHHVPAADRSALTREVYRVLKPGALLCVIEHNPLNPITRLVVARAPVDASANLLSHWQTSRLMQACGFKAEETCFFMYLPVPLYRLAGGLEEFLKWLPLGGQYAVFGRRSISTRAV